MESGTCKILPKVLTRRELDKIANESVAKIEKYFEDRFDEFITSQALFETQQRENGKYHDFKRVSF